MSARPINERICAECGISKELNVTNFNFTSKHLTTTGEKRRYFNRCCRNCFNAKQWKTPTGKRSGSKANIPCPGPAPGTPEHAFFVGLAPTG